MRICKGEIFGPAQSIISSKDLNESFEIANSVDYGLSSAIYTGSIRSVLVAIKKFQAGLTYVNHPTIRSQVHMSFGGVNSLETTEKATLKV
jgi:alpha-ketoglutaric semialdehyde dehydrogenase